MSHLTIQVLSILALAGVSLAALALGPSPVHPDNPNKCWNVNQKKTYAIGDIWQQDNCVRVTCTEYKGRMFLEYATCGSIGVPPICTLKRDFSLPYPSCCPVPSCPEPDYQSKEDLDGSDYDDYMNWIDEHFGETQVE